MIARNDNEMLFRPLRIGAIELPHRIVMAPLTRARATDRAPNALMEEYYRQRSSAALIISEATAISEQGYGWHGAPGIYTDAHVKGWRNVTDAVHAAGGRIFLQLWHTGRVSHPDFQRSALPVGPSPVAADGEAHTPTGKKPYVVPHELSIPEIANIVHDYADATCRARDAGFDGVEIHGANGYLIDQFLRDSANRRSDQYGGSLENRSRFLCEVIEAVATAWSADRTGVRLSPTMNGNGMSDSDAVGLYSHIAARLNQSGLAYLHIAEAIRPGRLYNGDAPRVMPYIRKVYSGVLLANGGYDKTSAADAIRNGEADAIVFGQKFIANPDLPLRMRVDASLNEADPATFYAPGPKGYTDYPALSSIMPNNSVAPPQEQAAVHWAIKLRAKDGKEKELESALERFAQRSLGEHGAIGVHLFRSTTDTGSREFLLHRSFLSREHSRRFYESEMYRQYQAETDDLIEGEAVIRPLHGFEAFFRSGGGTPPRWKMAIVTWLGVFPAVLFWSSLLSTHLYMLHPVAITAVVTLLVVVSLTWAIMPRLTGALRPWLSKRIEEVHLRVPHH